LIALGRQTAQYWHNQCLLPEHMIYLSLIILKVRRVFVGCHGPRIQTEHLA